MTTLSALGLEATPRIAGSWDPIGEPAGTFDVHAPETGEPLWVYPRSDWAAVDRALSAGFEAFRELRDVPHARIGAFLETFADRLEADADRVSELASLESGLPQEQRFRDVELPRTIDQLRQAAEAAAAQSWTMPTLDPARRVASVYEPIPGVVLTIGPNNFPLAFNAVSGGDAAAAFATGHPVLAKGHPNHPATTELLARHCAAAVESEGLPPATIQVLYDLDPEDGLRVVGDARTAATAFTGSAGAGMRLKEAADAAGRPIYVEMGSLNPMVILESALRERDLAPVVAGSVLLGGGQFCTKPGLVVAPEGSAGDRFVDALASEVGRAGPQTVLSPRVRAGLEEGSERFAAKGARLLVESAVPSQSAGWHSPARLFAVDDATFARELDVFGREVFGSLAVVVRYHSIEHLRSLVGALPGSLVASLFIGEAEADGDEANRVIDALRGRVGRIAFDKPPTGVLVSPAMNHGGPFPATGHPGFTAVGIPASLRRFGHLQCYDNAAAALLPAPLDPDNPLGLQRLVNGRWTEEPCEWDPGR